jgi:hypothetical protein
LPCGRLAGGDAYFVTFAASRGLAAAELCGMTTYSSTQTLVAGYIRDIWNERRFDRLPQYLHPAFTDHSLPPTLPPDVHGLEQWITLTGQSFEHHTVLEEQVTEPGKSILKIRMELRHIGQWRGIAVTGREVTAVGYRCFREEEGRIIEHWALIDGNAIENQLRETEQGCKVQR